MASRSIHSPADLVQLLTESNGRLLVNMYPAVGHVVPEVDNFVRRRRLGELPSGVPFLLCMPPNQLSFCVADCYRSYFEGVTVSQEIYEISKKVAYHYPELTVDIGISSLKLAPDPNRPTRKMPWFNDILYMLTQEDTGRQWLEWYRRRRETIDYRPIDHNLDRTPALEAFLGAGIEKYAVFQIKDKPTTAVATPTETATYFDTLGYLRDNGYTLVLVGREKYREELKHFGVLNYAGSDIADFKHDLLMFKHARLAVTAGSGIAIIADLFDTPLVYANTWHLDNLPFSAMCNAVPTLLKSRATGKLVSFAEHGEVFNQVGGSTNFPWTTHEPRNPDGQDILAAVREVLEPGFATAPLTPAQHRAKYMRPDAYSTGGFARTSQAFLEKFSMLL
ncbi:MAG: TIGR04372 family glycosyltransferase [Alphaproteobacteria bacterium]